MKKRQPTTQNLHTVKMSVKAIIFQIFQIFSLKLLISKRVFSSRLFTGDELWNRIFHPAYSPLEYSTYPPYSPNMPYPMDSQPQSPSTSETSENSTYTSKKRKRTPWTSTEGQILIELCKEHKISLKGNGSSQKWEGITRIEHAGRAAK